MDELKIPGWSNIPTPLTKDTIEWRAGPWYIVCRVSSLTLALYFIKSGGVRMGNDLAQRTVEIAVTTTMRELSQRALLDAVEILLAIFPPVPERGE